MIITVDILKKINNAIEDGKPLTLAEVGGECSLDLGMLSLVAGDLSQNINGMDSFFLTIESYLIEMDKRVKKMSKLYKGIQQMQIQNGTIAAAGMIADPPIRW